MSTSTCRIVLILSVVLAAPTAVAAQVQIITGPEREMIQMPGMSRQNKTGTGRIRGRVLAADSGNPLRRAQIRISSPEILPKAAEIDRTHAFPRAIVSRLGELGLMGVAVPEEWGGAGMDTLSYALALEEISRACASTGVTMSVHNSLFQSPLLRHGTEEQKQRFVPPAAKGEKIGAYSLTEPGSGTDAAALRTSARKDGSDYVLDGTKNFVTNGGFADVFLIYARTNADPAAKHDAISAFVVERSAKAPIAVL